jgi:HSP20 family protein
MDIMDKVKEVGNDIEESIEKGYEKGKEVLSNVASHLPFTNLAKKQNGDFHVEIDMPGVKKKRTLMYVYMKMS